MSWKQRAACRLRAAVRQRTVGEKHRSAEIKLWLGVIELERPLLRTIGLVLPHWLD